jgi:iron complex outermembrane recepter protein
MSTRLLFTIFILLMSFSTVDAQFKLGTVSGLIEEPDHTPAAFATLQLKFAADSTLSKADYSRENGSFSIVGVEPGRYFLQVSYVGYKNHYTNVFTVSEGEEKALPGIMLQVLTKELATVTVTAQKPIIELKPDRTVFNVEGSINAVGSDALELLQKSPGVVVDNNDQIMLQGKSGVVIYIDGKQSPLGGDDLANYLRGLQSTDIEAIEIITNPSSKYDAEGNAGIINIRLKKNKNFGTNATVNLGYRHGVYGKFNNSLQVSHRTSKLNAYGTYSHYHGRSESFNNFFRLQNGLQFDQRNVQTGDDANHNFRVGTDFFPAKHHTFGVLVNGYVQDKVFKNNGVSDIGPIGQVPEQKMMASNRIDESRDNFNANLNYQFRNDRGIQWNIDMDAGWFVNRGESYQPNRYTDYESGRLLDELIFTNSTPTDITMIAGKIDHERPLGEGVFSVGAKSAMITTDNTFDFYQLENGTPIKDLERSNEFTYDEWINAVYANFQRSFGEQWNFQGGLRVEHTHSVGELTSIQMTPEDYVERDYINFFPSAGISYKLSEKHGLRLNYSRRIDRPNYQELNPFEFRLDELAYRKGNAFLQPQYTNNIQLSHSFNSRINTTIGYTLIDDYFTRIVDTVEQRRSFLTTKNLSRQEVWNISVSAPYTVTSWWNGFANLNMYQTTNKADFGDGRTIDLTVQGFTVFSQQNFQLGGNWQGEISGFFNSPGVWGGVMETESMWGIDLGLQKRLWDGKANVKLTVTDIFFTRQWAGRSDYGGMIMDANGGWESRQMRLNFSYMFGNKHIKNARNRTTSTSDEQQRLQSSQ